MFHFIYIPHPLYLCLSETLAFDCFYFLCMLHTFLFLCMRHRSSERLSVISNSLQPPWNSPGQNTGVGSLSLIQGIFPNQGLNPGLPHWRQILYQLSHKNPLYKMLRPWCVSELMILNKNLLLNTLWGQGEAPRISKLKFLQKYVGLLTPGGVKDPIYIALY